eukprot:gene4860-8454_t
MKKVKVLISKKKTIPLTINPQTTSYLSLKQTIQELRQEDSKTPTEFLYLNKETKEWTKITTEWCWQELIQSMSPNDILVIKLYKPSKILQIQQQFSYSFGTEKQKGVSGLIGQMENELRYKAFQQTLEKLRELGYSNTERCIFLIVKHCNDFELITNEYLNKNDSKTKFNTLLTPQRILNFDNHWIKEEERKENVNTTLSDIQTENIVKNKIQLYSETSEPKFFMKFFAEQIDSTKRDSLAEKVQQLKNIGFSDEHLSLYFLLKRNEDVQSTAMDLKKIQQPK